MLISNLQPDANISSAMSTANEAQSIERAAGVFTIAGRGAIGLGQQAAPLIVAHGLHVHPRAPGQLADRHFGMLHMEVGSTQCMEGRFRVEWSSAAMCII